MIEGTNGGGGGGVQDRLWLTGEGCLRAAIPLVRDSCGARSQELESLPPSGWTRGSIRHPEAVVPNAKRDFTASPNEEDAPGG